MSHNPWSANTRFVDGQLMIAGKSAIDLEREFGTPVFILDEEDFIFLQNKSNEILKNPYTLIPNIYWPECIVMDSNLVLTCQTDDVHDIIEKIVYKKIQNKINFLMIRRRNSIGFVQIIRGKYAFIDVNYL